jgi:hypothetical protein
LSTHPRAGDHRHKKKQSRPLEKNIGRSMYSEIRSMPSGNFSRLQNKGSGGLSRK